MKTTLNMHGHLQNCQAKKATPLWVIRSVKCR